MWTSWMYTAALIGPVIEPAAALQVADTTARVSTGQSTAQTAAQTAAQSTSPAAP